MHKDATLAVGAETDYMKGATELRFVFGVSVVMSAARPQTALVFTGEEKI